MAVDTRPDWRCTDQRHRGPRPPAVAVIYRERAKKNDSRLLLRCQTCLDHLKGSPDHIEAAYLLTSRVRRAPTHDQRPDDYDRTAAAVKRTFTEPPDLITHHP